MVKSSLESYASLTFFDFHVKVDKNRSHNRFIFICMILKHISFVRKKIKNTVFSLQEISMISKAGSTTKAGFIDQLL